MEPGAAVADSTTPVPWSKLVVQVVPQLIPAGELVIVPVPAPVGVMVNEYWGGARLNTAKAVELPVKLIVQVEP